MTYRAADTRLDLERLIHVAGASDDLIVEHVESMGVERTARTVVREVLDRVDLRGCPPIDVLFRLHTGAQSADVIVCVAADGSTTTPAAPSSGAVAATVEQSLPEFVRSVLGPRGAATNATRVLHWPDLSAFETFGRPQPAFEPVRRLLDSVDHGYRATLAELCVRAGSDKWGVHQYPQHYAKHFEMLRDRPLTILEIGVGGFADPRRGGESLRMWKRYFPRATVYGIDIVDKSELSEPRITVLRADQSAPADLARVLETTGPLDLVIDDGSHLSAHVIASFDVLFPALRPGGMYVIEDLQTSYWPHFGGRSGVYDDTSTSMGFLKALIDGLNFAEIDGREPRRTDTAIKGMHFYHNIVFVEKGENRDEGAPAWLRGA
ncbi:class I SAM-dependent methyltransferase [Nocardia brasiliensis]|uniref:class I SAM-dependent methyltransferase n=1 Tax=Nocardia brasiliensis TaxID=37326 RepID=UPI002454C43F|nr:class I SAM-dependent methyltransferase [Nocardia brasiliensis]